MLAQGYLGEGEIYRAEMRQVRENLCNYPRLIFSRMVTHTRKRLRYQLELDNDWFFWFWVFAWLFWPSHQPGLGLGMRAVGLLPALLIGVPFGRGTLLALALVAALFGRPKQESRLLAGLFLGTLLAVGVFGSSMQRLTVMFQWSYIALQFGLLARFLAWTRYDSPSEPIKAPSAPLWKSRYSVPSVAGAALLAILCGGLVVYRNTAARTPWITAAQMRPAMSRFAGATIRQLPELFTPGERAAAGPFLAAPLDVVQHLGGAPHGALCAVLGQVYVCHYFPANSARRIDAATWFAPRTYDFTCLRLAMRNDAGHRQSVDLVLPGDARRLWGRPVCFLARVNSQDAAPPFADAIAWCPWTGDSLEIDDRSDRCCDGEPVHRARLRALIGAVSQP